MVYWFFTIIDSSLLSLSVFLHICTVLMSVLAYPGAQTTRQYKAVPGTQTSIQYRSEQAQQELSMIVKNQYTLISYSISIPYAFSIFVYLITVATISQNFRFFSRRVNREIVRSMVEAYSAIWRTSAGLSARDIESSKKVLYSIQQRAYARMSLGVTELDFSLKERTMTVVLFSPHTIKEVPKGTDNLIFFLWLNLEKLIYPFTKFPPTLFFPISTIMSVFDGRESLYTIEPIPSLGENEV